MIQREHIEHITSKIVSGYDPDKIILFGSFARGNFSDDSDLDLIIIKQSEVPRHNRETEIRRLFYGLNIPMNIKIYTPAEYDRELQNKYSFLTSATKSSEVLYERKPEEKPAD